MKPSGYGWSDRRKLYLYQIYGGWNMFEIRKIQEQAIVDAVRAHSNAETADEIVYGKKGNAKGESNPEWVNSTMHRLEECFDAESVKQIRMDCQCGYGMDEKLAFLKGLIVGSSSMEEFAGSEQAKAAGLFCEDGVLYLQFLHCPCPMLSEVSRLKSKTWCQCTTGYSKVLFEKAFGCKVEVELLKSIKAGDEVCLMKILPIGVVWESVAES